MIIKRAYCVISALLSILLMASIFQGCERRPLSEDLGDTALVPIHIDWSSSLVDLKETHNVSIWFYPLDGSPAFVFTMEGDLSNAVVPLGVGEYSIIIFNESVDLNDYESSPLVFSDHTSYNDFSVATKIDNSKGGAFYAKSTDIPLRRTPDVIASWSADRFEVTWDMVVVTRTRSKANIVKSLSGHYVSGDQMNVVDRELSKVVNVTPLPLVKSVMINANVKNLVAAANVVGKLTGVTTSMNMVSRKPLRGVAAHTFIMSVKNAQWDDPLNKKDGTLSSQFWIFEHQSEPTYQLDVNFQLTDGKWVPKEFEINDKLDKDVVEIIITVGTDPAKPDDVEPPIVLPDPESNSVGVDGWEDEIIPLGGGE